MLTDYQSVSRIGGQYPHVNELCPGEGTVIMAYIGTVYMPIWFSSSLHVGWACQGFPLDDTVSVIWEIGQQNEELILHCG